jgi:hypothetical protein
MTTVFIGGSRKISRLDEAVRHRLGAIVEKRFPVVIGDANGADKSVQTYLRDVGYEQVTVYCTGDTCRNNVGSWPIEHIDPPPTDRRKDRKFFTLKDRAMSRRATHGLMLWDGESLGTLVNVVRLRRENRASVVYVEPQRSFVEVKTDGDLTALAKAYGTGLFAEAERAVASEFDEPSPAPASANLALF